MKRRSWRQPPSASLARRIIGSSSKPLIRPAPLLLPITPNRFAIPQKTFSWHTRCSSNNRHAPKTQCKGWKCPRRHHPSERRLPLRQPPAEQPFSASLRNWNPVRNDWVLLHLDHCFSTNTIRLTFCFIFSQSCSSPSIIFFKPPILGPESYDGICHLDGDVFCLFDSFPANFPEQNNSAQTNSKKLFLALAPSATALIGLGSGIW
jgi:hypothetical protein